MASTEYITFTAEKTGNDKYTLAIAVHPSYINALYRYQITTQQDKISTQGFSRGTAPLTYLEYTFKHNILAHLKELLFTHCVINELYQQIAANKLVLAAEPTLRDITLDLTQGARYSFECASITPPVRHDWKRLPFKAPTRKNYKDLDRQVEHFLQTEQEATQQYTPSLKAGDWVLLGMTLVDKDNNPLLSGHTDYAWLRLGDEIIDRETYQLLHDKKQGDEFLSDCDFLQEYINNNLDTRYIIRITIKDHIPYAYFSLDQFKKHFKLKTARETHAKLIEAFSFRNDISQRRETIEATFQLLFNQYPFTAPEILTTRQQALVLKTMQSNPDYNVYKTQPDFKAKVRALAEKQVKEHIIIDYLTYQEQMVASPDDVLWYLNLTKRPRMKEFIYFDIPSFKAKGQEIPIPSELVRYCCLQEKTLNHVINNLTKKS